MRSSLKKGFVSAVVSLFLLFVIKSLHVEDFLVQTIAVHAQAVKVPAQAVKVPAQAVTENITQLFQQAVEADSISKVRIVQETAERNILEREEERIMKEKKSKHLNVDKQTYKHVVPHSEFQWLHKDKTVLIYSAHFDNRDGKIKIVGFKHRFKLSTSDIELVLCRYPDKSVVPMTTLYNVSVLQPRPHLQFNTWIWSCSWTGESPPTSLSLVTQSQRVLVSRVNVTYYLFPEGTQKSKQPVVCVKPMVNNYSDAYQLIEFIESSRLWGVGKIVLYPQSIYKPVILPVLEKYRKEGYIDVHWWTPPVPMESLHAYGQKSHNQHCLYTYMYRYEWAGFIDLDELIIANEQIGNIEFMIQAGVRSLLDSVSQSNVAGFILRSQMCITSLPDDPLFNTEKGSDLCKITSFRKTNCTPAMSPGVWSKPLVNTDGTEIVDIHMIRLPRPGFTPIDLDPSIGTVHHYRALSHDSLVLAQSPQYNVLKRNTHIYQDQVKQILPSMCNFNNPNIGEMNFAD